jgi:predicted nucleotidyltransferase
MMKVLDRIDIADDVLTDLARRYHVREFAVFGSVLRDDFRTDSDIDVLVEYEAEALIGLFDHFKLAEELEQLLGRRVDLVSKSALHRLISKNVLDSRRVLYAA